MSAGSMSSAAVSSSMLFCAGTSSSSDWRCVVALWKQEITVACQVVHSSTTVRSASSSSTVV